MTTFVGRGRELTELVRRLEQPGLITLTGGPGSGKSRLALEAARVVAAGGRAVRAIKLTPAYDPDAVLAAIAEADAGGNELLVLDNAEHMAEPVSQVVADLLAAAPKLTILVTSHHPLRLSSEKSWAIEPLDPVSAAQLFTERCAVDAQDADPEHLAAICTALDRLPLGIELAAGLTRTVTVPQLAERLAAEAPADVIAVLDWSHELLDDAERAVLHRVADFADGFTLEAAEQVAVDPRDVAPALTELADRGLLTVEAVGGRRFRMLETIRGYVLAKPHR
jgi:predicted ATPase